MAVRTSWRFAGALLAVAASTLPAGAAGRALAAPAPSTCAGAAAGGDWPQYGHDLANTRVQPNENSISAQRVGSLHPRWSFSTGQANPTLTFTDFNSVPIVSGGCVYVGAATGDVYALNAATGMPVWRHHITLVPPGGGFGGDIVGSLASDGSTVYVFVSQLNGPYAMAFDAATGAVRWRSAAVDTYPGVFTNASPSVFDGMVFMGFSPPEGDPAAHGGFVILDAQSGAILAKTYTIPQSDWAQGYAGGGIWSTPAVDISTGYAYIGSGNPFSKEIEHARTNAILKVDVDRRRPTFGSIVASYKGEIDQFDPLLRTLSRPTCRLLPENPTIPFPLPPAIPDLHQFRDSVACLQMDLDFGAPPNIFKGADGVELVGDLQKSGYYHVVRADTMARVRQTQTGLTCLLCNAAATAYDPATSTVFADVTPGTLVRALDPTSGHIRWSAPVLDGVHYEGVSVADGVVYTVDTLGFLDAFAATSGLPLLRRSLLLDAGPDVLGLNSVGVAIARHTVYVAAGNHVVAYQPS